MDRETCKHSSNCGDCYHPSVVQQQREHILKLEGFLEKLWQKCWSGELPTDYAVMAKQVGDSMDLVAADLEEVIEVKTRQKKLYRYFSEGRKRWIKKHARKGT